MKKNDPRYRQVKSYILDGISQQLWSAGERVPSENELVDLCKVSRMTARRALQELYHEGTLVRVKGKGSFVAEEKQQSSLIQIRSIASEIREQGHEHHAQLLLCERRAVSAEIEKKLGLNHGDKCEHSQLLHFQDDHPIQLEYRWVNSEIAPDYHQQSFAEITPSEYLSSIAPVTEAEHQVEAIIGDKDIRHLLKLDFDEAVLFVERKTWCHNQLVSFARLYHPGKRYRLGTKFKTV
ncbi:histidine utilization repressor [Aliikangiella marina]|uniref:Histidine utilization repressor n=1 Tax=Aliikangiella marina TaxID=1712262 RepID=A0A545T2D9_9GAMM|nr:histidine utilization repressor [Aliikangiella marina]TQV71373.1 histidine utilization repressor [Aliikangiella marina]